MPRTETPHYVAGLFDGPHQRVDFPFGRTVRYVENGDYLYLVYRGRIHGRLRIVDVEQQVRRTIEVGSDARQVRARTVVWVQCPGELAPGDYPRNLRRGHQYDRVPEWPD